MKLTGKQIGITASAGLTGLFAGVLLIGGGVRIQLLSLAGLLALPPIAVSLIVVDTRSQGKINQAEAKASEAQRSLDAATIKLAIHEEKEAQLQFELAEVQTSLNRAKELLKACEAERCQSAATISQQYVKIDELQSALISHQERVEALEVEVEEWEVTFHGKLDSEAQRRFQIAKESEIKRIEAENDVLTREAIDIAKQYRQWANLADARLQDRREFVHGITDTYNSKITDFKQSYSQQVAGYLAQIEALNCKVAVLQQKLQGDLVEPEYGQFGYQWDARIADDIARHIWSALHIPLAVRGYRINSDGSAEGGYGYGRQSPEALIRDLNRISDEIATALGIHAISSIQKHELSDLLIISWRRERPKPISEDAFYRLVEPASACTKLIREAMDHRKGGKPTLRIMGATGEGKGIIAKVLLADWVKSESGEVWLSDPMDGSAEDRWEVPKVAKSSREARELLKAFKGEFDKRKDKVSSRKSIHVLALFDEFDKEHPRDDKDLVKSIWTAIRHHNMRLILMGQSSEVGSNGWQWDEMKNCACLFVGTGITTAIKHAKDLGLSRATANQLETQNDQIMNWLESKNQGLDAANQYRVGLLVCGDKARFVEFPSAHKGAIKSGLSSIVSHPWESVIDEQKPSITESRICPGCGGKLRKAGSKLRCESLEHSKEMGKKTFDLNC